LGIFPKSSPYFIDNPRFRGDYPKSSPYSIGNPRFRGDYVPLDNESLLKFGVLIEKFYYDYWFFAVYRADMPKWLPINYVYKTLVNILSRKFHKWFHLFVVFIIWLYFLPVCTCKFITIVILYLTRIIIIVTIQYNTEVHTCSILIASFYE
jgi:hypothetical protein